MSIRARVYCHKEQNKWDRRGYIYCWYYHVYDTANGRVLASDNTADWGLILASALYDRAAIARCSSLGLLHRRRNDY